MTARRYSTMLWDQGKALYDQKKYQEGIPFTIYSIWETLKAVELISFHSCSRPMSAKYWTDMMNHTYKFTNLKKLDLDGIARAVQMHYETIRKMIGVYDDPARLDANDITRFLDQIRLSKQDLEMYENMCVRSNWDSEVSSWSDFSVLPEAKKHKIAKYVDDNARVSLYILYAATHPYE